MRRITGTHFYSYAKCPRLAALALHLPRSERRAPHPWEEFAAARGRDFEDQVVASLGAVQPTYPERDFAAGAQATLALMREGAPLIHQGVLLDESRLGLPDLLRKVDGASALGPHHYEVIDVKTSGRARGDQALQVMFYSRLLADIQGRMPERGAILLKDRTEHRFATADYAAVAQDVEQRLLQLSADGVGVRPFLQGGCASCHWNHKCLPELEAKDDLSLVAGMSHGARAILEAHGVTTTAELAALRPDRGRLSREFDGALLRTLKKCALARQRGAPQWKALPKRAAGLRLEDAPIVHLLADPFADRVLWFAALLPGGAIEHEPAWAAADEWPAFCALQERLPRHVPLLHFGPALQRWHQDQAVVHDRHGAPLRFVDLQRRLAGGAAWPQAIHSLEDFVRAGLQRDPWRAGCASAAAMWVGEADARQRLQDKAAADLEDLDALRRGLLSAARAPAEV